MNFIPGELFDEIEKRYITPKLLIELHGPSFNRNAGKNNCHGSTNYKTLSYMLLVFEKFYTDSVSILSFLQKLSISALEARNTVGSTEFC